MSLRPINQLSHRVECLRLTREHIGDPRFERELRLRLAWLRQNCSSKFDIEGIREAGKLVGRRFLFSCPNEALWFKMRFPTRL